MVTLEQQIEAVLFYAAEPLTAKQLASILEISTEEVSGATLRLHASLSSRGIQLLMVGDKFELVTIPETSDVIGRVKKEEMQRDLGKAGSETLAVVIYRGPVSRADIEYVRGVNCSVVLRSLLIRGLVARIPHPSNARAVLYQATTTLLKDLGVTQCKELPDYEKIQAELDTFTNVAAEETPPETTKIPPHE